MSRGPTSWRRPPRACRCAGSSRPTATASPPSCAPPPPARRTLQRRRPGPSSRNAEVNGQVSFVILRSESDEGSALLVHGGRSFAPLRMTGSLDPRLSTFDCYFFSRDQDRDRGVGGSTGDGGLQ